MRSTPFYLAALGLCAGIGAGALFLGSEEPEAPPAAEQTNGANPGAESDSGATVLERDKDSSSRDDNRFSLGAATDVNLGFADEGDAQPAEPPQPETEKSAPLPSCSLTSTPAKYVAYKDWDRTLLDYTYKLPKDYAPNDLVSVGRAGLRGNGMVREFVVADLKKMGEAAAKAGAPIEIQSGYRSYADQEVTFQRWVNTTNKEHALVASARAGHSEHQLGTVIDVRSKGEGRAPWSYEDWADTKAGAWMLENSWKYGFILSYPKGESETTCYMYESWHFRYMGIDGAREIHESGHTLREYLWSRQDNS